MRLSHLYFTLLIIRHRVNVLYINLAQITQRLPSYRWCYMCNTCGAKAFFGVECIWPFYGYIVGTLGCVFIDNETHESGVTKCTTGEAWSAFSWHPSSVFHCQWTHNQVFLLLSHMLIQNAKSIFIYVMKYVSGFIWKLGISFVVCIKWIDETWWNNRLLLVPNCYEVVAMVATMVAMVAPLWCHTLR